MNALKLLNQTESSRLSLTNPGMKKLFVLLIAGLFLVQCNTTRKAELRSLQQIPATILGDFTDDYNIRYTISNNLWFQHPNAKYHLLRYDSAGEFFIARNDSKNSSDPGLYSRIDIMHFKNMEPWRWGFCLTGFNAKSVEEAITVKAPDRANPKKGCGGYPFSRMKRN
jgi:hypothetical protein